MAVKSANLYARIEPKVNEETKNSIDTGYLCFKCHQYILQAAYFK